MNRRYYDSDYSYIKNVVAADAKDNRVSYFCRLMILRLLSIRFSQPGPTGLKGYFPVWQLISDLAPYGVSDQNVRRELEYLAKAQCVVSEDFRVDALTGDDLVRLAPAGFVHLEMIGNVHYLAAVAEDTWFDSQDVGQRVAERIGRLETQYHAGTAIQNARDLTNFLQRMRTTEAVAAKLILEHSAFEQLTDLSQADDGIARLERSLTTGPWSDVSARYKPGTITSGTIVNVKEFGIFVEVEPGVTGLIHQSKLPSSFLSMEECEFGEKVDVEILAVDAVRRRMEMNYRGTTPVIPGLLPR